MQRGIFGSEPCFLCKAVRDVLDLETDPGPPTTAVFLASLLIFAATVPIAFSRPRRGLGAGLPGPGLAAFNIASELMDFQITRGSLHYWCVTSTHRLHFASRCWDRRQASRSAPSASRPPR